jgi:YesN/AraC family two-component response regulator
VPFQEAFLRRLLAGDKTTEEELLQSRFFLPGEAMPNVVCFIQGFVRSPGGREQEGWEPREIQECFRKRFQGYHLTFLSYRKHLLMLIQVPAEYVSLMHWKEGEHRILDAIQALENEHEIYLYIGVGSIYREPLLLHHSYREACKARRTTPYERTSLRYFEEITKDVQIQKCTDYIARYCIEDLSLKRVADQINLSVPYFSRIFKQETGRNFVEYVTFVRLQRAVWLLRHTNHTIEWIAEELGFNTPNYFSGTFKKYVGLSPREYRATEEIIFI